jgi:predicted O-methyltransferase YrrM
MDFAMKPLAPLPVRQLLNRLSSDSEQRLGAEFLVDDEILSEIVRIAEIPADSTVLEIGPGLGGLTRYLAEAADDVVAVELDRRMYPAVKRSFKKSTIMFELSRGIFWKMIQILSLSIRHIPWLRIIPITSPLQ